MLFALIQRQPGAVATAQGLGAALSATLAGLIVVGAGFSTAFLTLAAIAGLDFVLYLTIVPETRGYAPPTPSASGTASAAA